MRIRARTAAALEGYDFPGNVRELRNLVEGALIESGGSEILPEHLRFLFLPVPCSGGHRIGGPPGGGGGTDAGPPVESRQADEGRIVDHVRRHGGINNATCRDLLGVGMHRAWYLLRRLHRAGVLRQEHSGRWTHYRLPEK